MSYAKLLILISIALSLPGCASARARTQPGAATNPDEVAAILATIDRFFIAMAEGDATAYAAQQTADGMIYSQRFADGAWTLRRRTNQEQLEALADRERTVAETYWEPTVLRRGPMAVVWAPYEFRIDGDVSHCGIDVFDMLKIDGQWVIGNAMWTVEPEACSELKPRPGAAIRPASLP